MRDRGHRFGGLIVLDQGIDLALDPPEEGPTYVDPTLSSWMAGVYDYPTYAQIVFNNCVTANEPCKIKWILNSPSPKQSIVLPITPNYQNSPHYATVNEYIAAKRGILYDLQWQWYVDGGQSGPILHQVDAIYVPAAGEGDSFQMG